MLLGVCDGHGADGALVSSIVAATLPDAIVAERELLKVGAEGCLHIHDSLTMTYRTATNVWWFSPILLITNTYHRRFCEGGHHQIT
jgi:hypothetical protein